MAKRNASNLDRFFWGFLMIGLGVLFLLDRLGYVELGSLRHWWPAIVILMGIAHLVRPRRVKDVGHGIMWVLFGLWFMAADQGWHGLTWNNSWPLALVAIGASIVAEVIFARAAPNRPEGDEDVRQIS